MTKLVQRREINVPIHLQESVDAKLLSQVSIVMNVLMDIGILEQMNILAAKVGFTLQKFSR